ncbi:hypothetical protein HF313_00490 [Massilia atriviolacea]|uniref:Metal-dependent hydrolase n=1 Tax=Massilia atriviolacea TaxID=2495579 RepID=A0A430HL34_9BURK|nr:hypothetical protein [Massilia atriviolacea]RSZ58213.1 hypothetical protein EJB06_14720 [Massilia atriviolacea]
MSSLIGHAASGGAVDVAHAPTAPPRARLALAVAACSHPVPDLLAGVHLVSLFWPLPLAQAGSPFGLLPGAGKLSLTNKFMWRNLLIECACCCRCMPSTSPALAWSIRIHGSMPFQSRLLLRGVL